MNEQGMSRVTKEEFKSLKLERGELKRLEPADGAKKDMFEVCGSRVLTKQEDHLGMHTSERIARVGEMISLLMLEIAKTKTSLSSTSSRSKAAKNQLQAT